MNEREVTANYCPHCGSSLNSSANYCQQCGNKINERTEDNADSHLGIKDDSGNLQKGATKIGQISSYIIGMLLLVSGVGLLAILAPVPFVLGLFFLGGAAWAFPPTRRRLQNRHLSTTSGHVHSTDEMPITDSEIPCNVCGSSIEEGVERTYREEYVLAGVPLFTTESGTNCYCRDCASGAISDTPVESLEATNQTDDKNPLSETEQ